MSLPLILMDEYCLLLSFRIKQTIETCKQPNTNKQEEPSTMGLRNVILKIKHILCKILQS